MAKNFMTSDITIPGTDVKFPAWAIVAAVGGILAVLILAPKRADQGDFNEEGMYADDSAGGAWLLIEELMDLMQGSGISEVLDPVIDNPRPTLSGDRVDDDTVVFNTPIDVVETVPTGIFGDVIQNTRDYFGIGSTPITEPSSSYQDDRVYDLSYRYQTTPGSVRDTPIAESPEASFVRRSQTDPVFSSSLNWYEDAMSMFTGTGDYVPPAPVASQTPYQDERQYTLPQYLAPVAPAAAPVETAPPSHHGMIGGLQEF